MNINKKLTSILLVISSFFIHNLNLCFAESIEIPNTYFTPWKFSVGKGQINFTTSTTNKNTKRWFKEGLKLLHSFEYQQAGFAFKKVQQLDPKYAMGYWGEAMSNLHLLWYAGDYKRAKLIYNNMHKTADFKQLNNIEKGLVYSLNPLLTKTNNITNYNNYMAKLYKTHPKNSEVGAFYALSILATRHGIYDNETSLKANNILQSLFAQFPRHPGIVHYIIHSNENSINYSRAQTAAEAYGKIAPFALHAVHMPSHVYAAQGKWNNSKNTNKLAWDRSIQRQKDLKLNDDSIEYHSATFLNDALLNLGQYIKAYDLINTIIQKQNSNIRNSHLSLMISNYLVQAPVNKSKNTYLINKLLSLKNLSVHERGVITFTLAYYNYKNNNTDLFNKYQKQFHNKIMPLSINLHQSVKDNMRIMDGMLLGLDYVNQNKLTKATNILKQVSDFEDNSFYENHAIKPPKELLGDILLKYSLPDHAEAMYQKSLILTKNRRLSLMGLLKAARYNQDNQLEIFASRALKKYCTV